MTNGGTNSGGSTISIARLLVVGGAIGVVFLVYISYLFSMQIVDGYIYTLRAEEVTRRSLVVTAPRGNIYDRNATTPIATNRESFAVEINPAEIPRAQIDTVFSRVAEQLRMPVDEIYRRIPERRYSVYQPIEIKSGLSFQAVTALAERKIDFPGVSWRIKPVRHYVDGDAFSHVLGYVGDITPEELQILFNRGYTQRSVIGKAGIELQYDQILRGRDGREFRTVDARGRRVSADARSSITPEQGRDVVLTLDRDIQLLTQKALGDRIGAAVVLHPATGEILSMVSYPGFDANAFYDEGGSGYFSEVSLDPTGSFINRTIQAQDSPASTFKVLMTAALLEEDAFPIDETVYCPGYYEVGNRVFKCHKEHGHGDVSLFEALAESCNVYFYTMGNEYLGIDSIVDYSRAMGLGERTGIDLPGERAGLVPSPEWKERTFNDGWRPGDTVNMSIGQGFLQVTPLQLADMVGAILNEGVVYRPHVLKEIRDPVSGAVVDSVEPEVLRTMPISDETFRVVKEAMEGVVLDGTPQVVMTTNAPVGGKTGTSQTSREERQHSWFIGFAPYGNGGDPSDYVVTVVWIDAANEWDWWSPYATNIIVHGIYNSLDYEATIDDLRTRRDPWLWYGRGLPE
ncbi:MAG: penicillin-binding protein 2 [Spirochaetota bacterium]